MFSKRFFFSAVAGTTLLLGLAGCGGSGGDNGVGSGTVAATPDTGAANDAAQSVVSDSFFARVLAIIADTSDTAEPRAIESTTAVTPEETQPQPQPVS
ncbi:hypothetical protein [Noviherbaspirillum sp. Root189]|uniref:hypothetical protein n=1 Tax=Noviherbaspirillum sp. Root189 TaxID=1736487 RepID=UPI00070BDB0E|nr:hypothetical protein [Noviherbaspirillum sp. Root189]KRB67842.1 hypothetical protein ASE07_09235 [Noviherbaspirillum sp. Root189]